MVKVRIEFKLSMPNRGSWNGKWSGEGRNYTIVKSISQDKYNELRATSPRLYWHYSWSDGWSAGVSGRVLTKGERKTKSDGFCGYDWMVDSILLFNQILDSQQREEITK